MNQVTNHHIFSYLSTKNKNAHQEVSRVYQSSTIRYNAR